MAENAIAPRGIGFLGMLTILFIGLKLGAVIDWSWFWVLSPGILQALIISFVLLVTIIAND